MNIGIVGLGLIGGSIGLKLQTLNHTVFGVTHNKFNKSMALKRKLANFVSCDLQILQKCSLIILATPISNLKNPSKKLIESIPKQAILTDVGSIKEPIVNKWEKLHPLFIGSHPMAGNEKKGVEAGYEELLDNAKWIITPTKKTNPKSSEILSDLIISMGCEIYQTTPKEHDQAVSLISHLPIFVASCLIKTVNIEENQSLLNLAQKLAASGFSDTSRVGGGNPKLGLDLAVYNNENIIDNLQSFRKNLEKLEKLIINKNWELLLKELEYSKKQREEFL